MAEFVNKVKKNDVEYEIRDARIPEADVADAGKVLKVADAGGYELGEAGGGGTQLYLHTINIYENEESQTPFHIYWTSTSSVQLTTYGDLKSVLSNAESIVYNAFSHLTIANTQMFIANIKQTGPNVETGHSIAIYTNYFGAVNEDNSPIFEDALSSWSSKSTFVFTDTVTAL